MWKDSIRNIVVIFQTTILKFVGFYVRRSATDFCSLCVTSWKMKIGIPVKKMYKYINAFNYKHIILQKQFSA